MRGRLVYGHDHSSSPVCFGVSAACIAVQVLHERKCRLGIKARRRLVEEQIQRTGQGFEGYRKTTLLSARQPTREQPPNDGVFLVGQPNLG
mmetsp:Transcript_41127/g.87642  ORF Transcript_41127/g.87642 Transcript_41127/m.87642 type:complete len:91 (-) Transcript_41127:891-1163(-)